MQATTAALLLLSVCLLAKAGGSYDKEQIASADPTSGVQGVKIGPDGQVYVCSILGQDIYTFDPTTGAFTPLGLFPLGACDDLLFVGDWIYYTDLLGGRIRGYNTVTGAYTSLTNGLSVPGANAITQDPASGDIYFTQLFLGDALWKATPGSNAAPQQVLAGLGGLNGFRFDELGRIVGPIWYAQQLARFYPNDYANAELIQLPAYQTCPGMVISPYDGVTYATIREIGFGTVICSVDFDAGTYTEVFSFPDHSSDNLDIDAAGNVWISFGDGSMGYASLVTGETATYRLGFGSLGNLKAGKGDNDDKIYHTGGFVAQILEFDRRGDLEIDETLEVLSLGSILGFPVDMDITDDGELGVFINVFGSTLISFNPNTYTGVNVFPVTGTFSPSSINFIDEEQVLVLDLLTGIHKVNTTDGVVQQLQQFSGALRGVVKRDKLYFTNFYTGEVGIYDIDTDSIEIVATGLDKPDGIDVDRSGNIYVVEKGDDGRVLKLSGRNGRILAVIDQFLPAFPFDGNLNSLVAHGRGLVLSENDRTVYVTLPVKNAIYSYER